MRGQPNILTLVSVVTDLAEKMWISQRCEKPDEVTGGYMIRVAILVVIWVVIGYIVTNIQQLINSEKLPTLYKKLALW